MLKAFLASAAGTRIVSALAAAYVRVVLATTSWRIEGRAHADALLAQGGPVVAAFWHGRLGAMTGLWGIIGGGRRLAVLSSMHRGGRWAAITPDGPRGPRMRVQPGLLMMARIAGAPVVPVAFSTTRGRLLGTWDRLLLPLPFGRGVYVVGAPIFLARDADAATAESQRLEIEAALTAVTREADRLCGRQTPDPAQPR
jgi:lysophospholipid acyltransferase (LPLAT)-like uncharacterized protein